MTRWRNLRADVLEEFSSHELDSDRYGPWDVGYRQKRCTAFVRVRGGRLAPVAEHIRHLYLTTNLSTRDIAARFGEKRSTIWHYVKDVSSRRNRGVAWDAKRIGKRYGTLVVVSRSPERRRGDMATWVCRCDCGRTVTRLSSSFRTDRGAIFCGRKCEMRAKIYHEAKTCLLKQKEAA